MRGSEEGMAWQIMFHLCGEGNHVFPLSLATLTASAGACIMMMSQLGIVVNADVCQSLVAKMYVLQVTARELTCARSAAPTWSLECHLKYCTTARHKVPFILDTCWGKYTSLHLIWQPNSPPVQMRPASLCQPGPLLSSQSFHPSSKARLLPRLLSVSSMGPECSQKHPPTLNGVASTGFCYCARPRDAHKCRYHLSLSARPFALRFYFGQAGMRELFSNIIILVNIVFPG